MEGMAHQPQPEIPVGILVVYGVILVLMIASMWKIFSKAGKPGWAAIVPIYNIIVMLQIVGRPVWWIILLIIPIVSFVISIILCFDLAKAFGKGGGFGVGLLLLGIIFMPILAFGSATYQGPVAGGAKPVGAPA